MAVFINFIFLILVIAGSSYLKEKVSGKAKKDKQKAQIGDELMKVFNPPKKYEMPEEYDPPIEFRRESVKKKTKRRKERDNDKPVTEAG